MKIFLLHTNQSQNKKLVQNRMISQQHLIKITKIFLSSLPNIGIIVLATFLHHPSVESIQFQHPSILQPVNHAYWRNITSYPSNLVKNWKSPKNFNSFILTFVVLYLLLLMDQPTSLHSLMII